VPIVIDAPAPIIDKDLATSIHGLADMAKELGGMLSNWSPKVTVDQAPVVVNVSMPWDTVWSSARGELDKEAEAATARATAVAVATAKALTLQSCYQEEASLMVVFLLISPLMMIIMLRLTETPP
jgi:hypothetical protein